MSPRLEQSALRLRGARSLKKQAKDALSDAHDELQRAHDDGYELRKTCIEQSKVLEEVRQDRDAATSVLRDHMQHCLQDGYAEQRKENMRALREAWLTNSPAELSL